MIDERTTAATSRRNSVFRAIADGRRRAILSALICHSTAVSVDELAASLLADERNVAVTDVPAVSVAATTTELRHRHLPILEAAGLIDSDEETVRAAEHLADETIDAVLSADDPNVDAVLDAFADECRRGVVRILSGHEGPMEQRAIATAVVETTEAAASVSAVALQLHHVHLPKLDAAGLVTYDADGGTAIYEGHPDVDAAWFESAGRTYPVCSSPQPTDS